MSVNFTPTGVTAGSNPTAVQLNAVGADAWADIQDAWDTYTPTITGVSTSTVVARYFRVGKRIDVAVSFTLTGTPTTSVAVSLPVTASTAMGTSQSAPKGLATGLGPASYRVGAVVLISSTTVSVLGDNTAGAWGPGVPVAWGSGNFWGLTFSYEAA